MRSLTLKILNIVYEVLYEAEVAPAVLYQTKQDFAYNKPCKSVCKPSDKIALLSKLDAIQLVLLFI